MIITFDEGSGYWDSGIFQPIDFFSPYARGERGVHTYGDHAPILKFIERK